MHVGCQLQLIPYIFADDLKSQHLEDRESMQKLLVYWTESSIHSKEVYALDVVNTCLNWCSKDTAC